MIYVLSDRGSKLSSLAVYRAANLNVQKQHLIYYKLYPIRYNSSPRVMLSDCSHINIYVFKNMYHFIHAQIFLTAAQSFYATSGSHSCHKTTKLLKWYQKWKRPYFFIEHKVFVRTHYFFRVQYNYRTVIPKNLYSGASHDPHKENLRKCEKS